MYTSLQQFKEAITSATASGTPLRIRGGGTKDWYGQSLRGQILDTSGYGGIVSYDPTELVITARCGTPLSEIESALREHHQMLAFEPPHFGPGATVGGVVASGLAGPRREAAGSVADFILGAVLIDGKGEEMHFGGQVMKNVAGYDVSRMIAGSMGMLGLIAEVSLKVLPKPFTETTVALEINQEQALQLANEWGRQPLPISATAWENNVFRVRLSGANAAVDAAKRKIGGTELSQADAWWHALREQQSSFFSLTDELPSLWRLSLPAVAPALDLPGEQLIEWRGAQRWLKSRAAAETIRAAAETIRGCVSKLGGHATLFKGGIPGVPVFHPLAPAIEKIHRRLKSAFDPANIFNPGRMYPDL